MSIEKFFTDPRRLKSQELAFFADKQAEQGKYEVAHAALVEAAQLEEDNAVDVEDAPKVRSVLAISAVALWIKAERWEEAIRAGERFLSEPEKLLDDGRRELVELVEKARKKKG